MLSTQSPNHQLFAVLEFPVGEGRRQCMHDYVCANRQQVCVWMEAKNKD